MPEPKTHDSAHEQPPPLAAESTQTEADWNARYARMSDSEKWRLWREYYERIHSTDPPETKKPKHHGNVVVSQITVINKSFFALKNQLRSMAVGLLCGILVIAVCSFTLFNEVIITPFIQPGETTVQSPVVDRNGLPQDTSVKIRIPKINVEIPVVYNLPTTDEKQFELALDQGVVHYPTTVLPGQAGNAAFFGHSSNNIFNPGKYKFAFVLLHELVPGDQFFLTYDGKLYTYEVVTKRVVHPTEVGVLGAVEGQTATATLITCDPPGTSTNRLVVVGKQIGPSPTDNQTPVAVGSDVRTEEPTSSDNLPGNGPGLWTRTWRSIFGE